MVILQNSEADITKFRGRYNKVFEADLTNFGDLYDKLRRMIKQTMEADTTKFGG